MKPILLQASEKYKAHNVADLPKQSDELYNVCILYSQSIQMPVFHLTTSEEFPINVAHFEVAGMCHYSTTIFITSSPIFTVHYEFCPPNNKIEEFTNPRLRKVSDLILKPSDHSTGMLFCMNWLNVKLTAAYGIHCAVQRVIGTENIQKVKKLKTQRLHSRMRKTVEILPQPDKELLLKAPKPNEINDAEEEFYDAVDSCELSIISSHTVEIYESHVCKE